MPKNEKIKEKILDACQRTGASNIPKASLWNYIQNHIVTFQELCTAGLADDMKQFLAVQLRAQDDALWQHARKTGDTAAYHDYLTKSQLQHHADEARQLIDRLDEQGWQLACATLTEEALRTYLNAFPNGTYRQQCLDLLDDLPWLEAKRRNTIDDYNQYRLQHPGRHDQEVDMAIRQIEDNMAWNNACTLATMQAYRHYVEQYPRGLHASEAQTRLDAGAAGEQFLDDLRRDPNAHGALEIQQHAKNGVVAWADIEAIYGVEKTDAIRGFLSPTQLPGSTAPGRLQGGSTEVYVWGTPGSGKTCARGTIISSATRAGILQPRRCAARPYMDLLSNVFSSDGVCTLPYSTDYKDIQEMVMDLRDNKKRNHRITLIDMAGELFRSVYKLDNKMFLEQERQQVLDKALGYLADRRNEKIHFFVVEYGAHDKLWDGLNMGNYLQHMIQYLTDKKIFNSTTVGVYVLVTKCDTIPAAHGDRPRLAGDYVTTQLPSFWQALQYSCRLANIKDLRILSFSVGDVFAQQLCIYDGTDTEKVIDKLLTKTHPDKQLMGWLKH